MKVALLDKVPSFSYITLADLTATTLYELVCETVHSVIYPASFKLAGT